MRKTTSKMVAGDMSNLSDFSNSLLTPITGFEVGLYLSEGAKLAKIKTRVTISCYWLLIVADKKNSASFETDLVCSPSVVNL